MGLGLGLQVDVGLGGTGSTGALWGPLLRLRALSRLEHRGQLVYFIDVEMVDSLVCTFSFFCRGGRLNF